MQALIHTGATTVKAKIPWHNYINYCDVYQNDVDSTDYVYIPYVDKLTPVVSSLVGYTKLFSHVNIDPKILPNLDSAIKWTGVSGVPPDINNWNRKDDPQPASVGVRFFFRDILDSNNRIIGTDNHVITDINEDPQTGACANKTYNYTDQEYVYEEDGTTKITEEDGITYIIE